MDKKKYKTYYKIAQGFFFTRVKALFSDINIHEKFKYENEYKKLNFGPIYRGFYETQKIFYDKFNGVSSLENFKKLPDLSIPCYTQVFQWLNALNNNEYWAKAGIK